jgi:GTP cyclohydrolase I
MESSILVLGVKVPVMRSVPVIKEISDRGATIREPRCSFPFEELSRWIEEIIEYVEKSASAPIFSLLKREDEKYITEHSFDNPRFVEDLSREVVLFLQEDDRIDWYRIEVISQESIHNHEAYACIEKE